MDDRICCSPSVFINSSESEKTRDAYRSALIEFCISKWGKGEFRALPPTGKSIAMTGIEIFRLENGKITEL